MNKNRGKLMENNRSTTRKTTIAITFLTVGCAVTGLHAAPPVTLVENGTPQATIVLPAETLWDRYLNASPEEIEAFTRARFPNASEERKMPYDKYGTRCYAVNDGFVGWMK